SLLLLLSLLSFLTDTPPPELYTLSLHDALPISLGRGRPAARSLRRADPHVPRLLLIVRAAGLVSRRRTADPTDAMFLAGILGSRSEEHTSELQSLTNLVCRLLLEKKNNVLNHTV